MDGLIVYKICDSSRLHRFAIPAFGTISSLLEQGSASLGKTIAYIVTETEGCQITTDLALQVFHERLLMLLQSDEMWTPVSGGNCEQPTGPVTATTSSSQQNSANQGDASIILQVPTAPRIVSVIPNYDSTSITPQAITVSVLDQEVESLKDAGILIANEDEGEMDEDSNYDDEEDVVEMDEEEKDDEVCGEIEEPTSSGAEKKQLGDDEVEVEVCSKKHFTSDLKFASFQIKWSKVSDYVLDRLHKLQNFCNENSNVTEIPEELKPTKTELNGLCNTIVDQLRTIDKEIDAPIMSKVAKQVFEKYPCLCFKDDDGFKKNTDYVWLKYKMIYRNSYLNRHKKTFVAKVDTIQKRKNRNLRAGTFKEYWEKTADQCTKEVLSKLSRDEPGLLTSVFLKASQPYVRHRMDEKIPLKEIMGNLPVLRRKTLLKFHFECATGVSGDLLAQYFVAKRSKIINYSKTNRKMQHLGNSATDLAFLCNLLGEEIKDVIILKEIGTKLDGIATDCSGPVIVAVDCGNNERIHYVYAEQVRLSEGTTDVVAAIADLMYIHYVHNFMYMKCISKFLEFIQEYFFKIFPTGGSKSNATRKGQQQRVVQRVIKAISNYSCKK